MSSHRAGLTILLIAVAVAGVIVGYAFAGLTDAPAIVTQAQTTDNTALLQAIATSVAPEQSTASVPLLAAIATSVAPLETPWPDCADVPVGSLCIPLIDTFGPCMPHQVDLPGNEAVPCIKQPEP